MASSAGFEVERLALPEVLMLHCRRFKDERGFFAETFRESDFKALGLPPFVQDNESVSAKGVLRGLHYQLNPSAQGKLVRCVRGRLFDVAADIRRGSPTYGRWVSAELSEDETSMIYVPPGFAHGFCALAENTQVLYRVTDYYSAQDSRVVLWNDPDLAVRWPLERPLLAPKDAAAPRLKDAENNFVYSR